MILVPTASLFSARILSLVFLPNILVLSEALLSVFFFLSQTLLIVLFSESLGLVQAPLSLVLAPEFFLLIVLILVRPP